MAFLKRFTALIMASFLVACGGGGGSSGSSNAAPVVTLASSALEVDEGTIVSFLATAIDPDGRVASYEWEQISGSPEVTFSGSGSEISFTAPEVTQDTEFTFKVTVIDTQGASQSATISIQVIHVNNDPSISSITTTPDPVNEGKEVTLSVVATDNEDAVSDLVYEWTQPDGQNITLSPTSASTVTFTAPSTDEDLSLTFDLTVTDLEGASTTDSVSVVVNYINTAPVIESLSASPDPVFEENEVTLSATASDAEDENAQLQYQWTQASGETVTIVSANTAVATFSAPSTDEDIQLEFELQVTDSDGATKTGSITVDIEYLNTEPSVSIEVLPSTVYRLDEVTLTASGSDAETDESSLTYQWTQLHGQDLVISDAETAIASFTAPNDSIVTEYELTVTVTDEKGGTATQTVTVTVLNNPPSLITLNATPDPANEGETVTLETIGSDIEDAEEELEFEWSQPEGQNIALSSTTGSSVSFTAPAFSTASELTFNVSVTDTDGGSTTEVITVTINSPPAISSFNATPNPANNLDDVTLTAIASDAETDASSLTYQWTQPDGQGLVINNAQTDTANFEAPDVSADTDYTLTVTVTDEDGGMATQMVTVTVLANERPTANPSASPNPANEGQVVTLAANSTDDTDSAFLTYSWVQTDGEAVTLSDATIASPSFTASSVSENIVLIFEVTVTDTESASTTDSVSVAVNYINTEPTVSISTANPNPVNRIQTVTLVASASDEETANLTYLWEQTSGTSGSFSQNDSASVTYRAPNISVAEQVELKVTVTDDDGATATDSVTIDVVFANTAPVINEFIGTELVDGEATIALGDTYTIKEKDNESDSEATGAQYLVNEVTLTADISDDDGDSLSFVWSQTSGNTLTLSGTDSSTLSFEAPDIPKGGSEDFVFQVSVDDGIASAVTEQITVTVEGINEKPILVDDFVDGPTYPTSGDTLTLSITASDPDSDELIYAFEQIQGTTVTQFEENGASLVLTVPDLSANENMVWAITVSDGTGLQAAGFVRTLTIPLYAVVPAGLNVGSDVQATQMSELDNLNEIQPITFGLPVAGSLSCESGETVRHFYSISIASDVLLTWDFVSSSDASVGIWLPDNALDNSVLVSSPESELTGTLYFPSYPLDERLSVQPEDYVIVVENDCDAGEVFYSLTLSTDTVPSDDVSEPNSRFQDASVLIPGTPQSFVGWNADIHTLNVPIGAGYTGVEVVIESTDTTTTNEALGVQVLSTSSISEPLGFSILELGSDLNSRRIFDVLASEGTDLYMVVRPEFFEEGINYELTWTPNFATDDGFEPNNDFVNAASIPVDTLIEAQYFDADYFGIESTENDSELIVAMQTEGCDVYLANSAQEFTSSPLDGSRVSISELTESTTLAEAGKYYLLPVCESSGAYAFEYSITAP